MSGRVPAALRPPEAAPAGPAPEPSRDDIFGDLPAFRRRGIGMAALLSRLRGLKSSDLAFIGIGIPLLFMAPLAEHFIAAPDDLRDALAPGFSARGAFFPDAWPPYEDGISGIAPGQLPGREAGVVTELTSPDPTSLIKPFSDDEAPPSTPAKPHSKRHAPREGWKEALSTAVKRSVASAVRHGRVPMPSVKLAGKLNALSSSGGGHSSSALHLSPPASAKELFGAPRTLSSLSRIAAAPDYRGTARGLASGTGWIPPAGGKALTWAGPGAPGSGAYLEPRPTGPGGAGSSAASALARPDFDGSGKSPGVNAGTLESKNISLPPKKEDLAYEARKLNMQKAIDLKWAKKTYDQLERKKMLEQMAAQTASQALLKVLDAALQLGQNAIGGKQGGGGGGGAGGGGASGGGGGGGGQSAAAAPEASGAPVPDPESGRIEGFGGERQKPKRVTYDEGADRAYGEDGRYIVMDEDGKPREVSERQQEAMDRQGMDPNKSTMDSRTGDVTGEDGTKVQDNGQVQKQSDAGPGSPSGGTGQ